ncbi:Rieske (2Fe-2S) protein [Pedomonas mirosovicensis]|uniref:Rieske (2Fe-2S) protein n=1 Tax=Pedomonas mirosovicensis TaxID=2908641 RepID=UPI002166D917|nr:Rieske (2Fe-2S) protein [Pedomonas mirosovicensis]MCH8684153.1 Rieske (2Fe-2S) protein [Pedomonas mirosovicensis]
MTDPKPDHGPAMHPVAREEQIPEGRALVVPFRGGTVLLYRWQGEVRAFRNRCPHVGTPLDLVPGRVFTADGQRLICATHGALFDPASGLCTAGPCRGKALEAAPIRLADGQIWLEGTG